MTDFLENTKVAEIDSNRSARAVQFLIDSAAAIGSAKAAVTIKESAVKRVLAVARSTSTGTSIQARDDFARQTPNHARSMDDLRDALVRYETLRAQRDAAIALIDYWRSMNANQRGAERGM